MHLDPRHQDLHHGIVDWTGITGASIRAFRFMHTGKSRHGPPHSRVVFRDAVAVVQGRDHGTDDEEANQRIDEDRATLTLFQFSDLISLPEPTVAAHQIATRIDRKSRTRTRIASSDGRRDP